jgi:organic hydroperoxide reductase OsmC/OhrA
MGKDERGRIALLTIRLRPQIIFTGRQPSAEDLARLHEEAHERCFIANSLRSEVVVEKRADG